MKIRELLSDETKWAKKAHALNSQGIPCNPFSRKAISFCLVGAIMRCYKTVEAKAAVYTKIQLDRGTIAMLFNDDPTTTFADIKSLVERLDI